MTTQEAYELMRVYLTRPGARRATDAADDVCRYETVMDGVLHRCAVGCLLTPQSLAETVHIEDNSDFDSPMWGQDVPLRMFYGNLEAAYQAGYTLPELREVNHGFLAGAQAAHDDSANWSDGVFDVGALDRLAAHHGLTVPSAEGVPQELVVA